jgi:hypothetical protein
MGWRDPGNLVAPGYLNQGKCQHSYRTVLHAAQHRGLGGALLFPIDMQSTSIYKLHAGAARGDGMKRGSLVGCVIDLGDSPVEWATPSVVRLRGIFEQLRPSCGPPLSVNLK